MGKKVFDKLFGWIGDAITKIGDFVSAVKNMVTAAGEADTAAAGAAEEVPNKAKETTKKTTTKKTTKKKTTKTGHALGGIFNREHVARFAEGNKAEAVIPLENESAMQPFVNAISQGILEGLMPAMVQVNGQGSGDNLPPMYVGTLIADERGLKQLYKKFELIKVQENARRGLAT